LNLNPPSQEVHSSLQLNADTPGSEKMTLVVPVAGPKTLHDKPQDKLSVPMFTCKKQTASLAVEQRTCQGFSTVSSSL
jgi:hypothetical protein